MGFANIGPGSLLLVLVIVILLFGTKKLRTAGKDLASLVKSFREGVDDNQDDSDKNNPS